MQNILDDVVDAEDLRKFRRLYVDQQKSGAVDTSIQFEYAWCLVRSKSHEDIKLGISLLEDLYRRDPDATNKRDYNYYLAIGHTKAKKYDAALHYVKNLLKVEPNNTQAQELRVYIDKKVEREGMIGVALVGGAAVAVGAVAALGLSLLRK